MKRLILMLSTAVCLLSSCQNYLDLKPKNQTVVGTLEDVKLMMSSYLFSLTSSDKTTSSILHLPKYRQRKMKN